MTEARLLVAAVAGTLSSVRSRRCGCEKRCMVLLEYREHRDKLYLVEHKACSGCGAMVTRSIRGPLC